MKFPKEGDIEMGETAKSGDQREIDELSAGRGKGFERSKVNRTDRKCTQRPLGISFLFRCLFKFD